MQERGRRRELRNAALLAAREARRQLARAITLLDGEPRDPAAAQLAAEVAAAVGALYGCEIGDTLAVLDRLREASAILSGVLARLHGPATGSSVDEAGELVAESLAMIYPMRAGLERELAEAAEAPRPRAHVVLPLSELARSEDARELAAVQLLAAQSSHSPDAREPDAARTSDERISVRPVPLVGSRPPPPVEALLKLASDRPPQDLDERPSVDGFFPDADVPPLLLTKRSQSRGRRRAVELVPDGDGELVDRVTGIAGKGSERREGERVELEVDIGLHSTTQFYAGLSNDISEGGLFVATVKPLPVGSELALSFVLPGGHAVHTRGRVAWLASPRDDEDGRAGMGVRFVKLEPQHRAAIDAFLRLRPPMLHEL